MKATPTAADNSIVLGSWVGGYRLVEFLGAGGHGEVYLGRGSSPWAAPVAIKVLRSVTTETRARLRQEASVLTAIDHPHVLRLIDLIDTEFVVALVTAYAAGGSLADRLSGEPLSCADAIELALRLSGALDEIHRAGVIHGDLTVNNILFSSYGHPLLADFGVAGWSGHSWSVAPEVTPWFAPPERCRGAAATAAGDVYGLAACMVAALGALSRPRLTVLSAADAVGDLAVGSALARVLSLALCVDPADRFPSASTFAAALAASHVARLGRRSAG